MDNNKLSGRIFGQQTTATRMENGLWKLHVEIREKLIYPDGQERDEAIESECIDKDFDTAHQIALNSALSELQTIVYGRNFDSLIEGKDYERTLNDNLGDNEDTPTQ